jgi:DNA polymerase-3 subunit beta
MKFISNKNVLVETLQGLLGPTLTKQNLPILSALFMSTTQQGVKFVTTDLDITIISFQEASVEGTGEVAVPMKRFISIMRELPPQDVSVEKTKNNLLIKCEKIEFKINTLNTEEFPRVKEGRGISLIKIDPQVLKEMLRLTSFCVGYEDVSYVLGGILFEVLDNNLNLVSTDGKRLAYIQKPLPPNQPEIKTKISFILPTKAINELYKLIKEKEEEVYLFVEENRVGFDFKHTQFIARPIEGEFPNYSQYIPKDSKDKLTVNRQDLLFALRRASLLSTSDYQGVKIELKKNTMQISKNTPQLGEVKELVGAEYAGAHLELGFNPNYLIDVLKNLEDERVCIDFFGADKPAVLKKEGYIYLLLPMKL